METEPPKSQTEKESTEEVIYEGGAKIKKKTITINEKGEKIAREVFYNPV